MRQIAKKQLIWIVDTHLTVCFFRAHLRFGSGASSMFSFPSGNSRFLRAQLPLTGIIDILLCTLIDCAEVMQSLTDGFWHRLPFDLNCPK